MEHPSELKATISRHEKPLADLVRGGIELRFRFRSARQTQSIDVLTPAVYFPNMSGAEIISEIPKLSHEARREIMRAIIESEQEAAILAECDMRAVERFQMLDAMEAEDEKNVAR